MNIYGMEKLSMVDFDGHLCTTLFLGGCNLRCPYCQNSDLVNLTNIQPIPETDVFNYLIKRKGIIDSVCISGGEPTLYPQLYNFISKIKDMGLLVKLDTNGTNPTLLQKLIDDKKIDYVAMDIKSSEQGYLQDFACTAENLQNILKSIEILKKNAVNYEFRTTLVASLHSKTAISAMAQMLNGAKRLYLQCFVDHPSNLVPNLTSVPKETALQYKEILSKTITTVSLRGY